MEKEIATARLEARLPADIHALLKWAAEVQGRTLTDFVVTAAREAAIRAIMEIEIIRLSAADQRIAAEAFSIHRNRPLPFAALFNGAKNFSAKHERALPA